MRFVAPARGDVEPGAFDAAVFADFAAWRHWLDGADWPALAELNAEAARCDLGPRFVAQEPALLADGLHYETRIARDGAIATRARSWHDLFNAMVWLRQPALKAAINARQAADVDRIGPRERTRAQCALTHFDEAGVLLLLRESARVGAWDVHDWPGLFAGLDAAAFAVVVIGHALLEHALEPDRLLVGKALALHCDAPSACTSHAAAQVAAAIAAGDLLNDPLELRPLPLMGLPGWHPCAGQSAFLRGAPCFQPRRAGREYPPALRLGGSHALCDPLVDRVRG